MTDTVFEGERIDPKQLFDEDGVDTERRTYPHEDGDHCEADAIGRAIVGVTDAAGRLLLLVEPDAGQVVLPNETVTPGEDWAEAGRDRVAGLAGIDVTIDGVERVRRVDHVVEGESTPRSSTHHVVFGASPTAAATVEGLCADNDWDLGWHEEVPVDGDDEMGAVDDVRLFLE